MILTIDIGNTTVSFGGAALSGEDCRVFFTAKLDTDREKTSHDYASGLSRILENAGYAVTDFEGAVLSSVVPPVQEAVEAAVESVFGFHPVVITAKSNHGLRLDVREPDKVGRDRLVDAAWAAAHYPLPAVTADLGTATTFNVILPGPVFAGGVICAGMATGLNALASRTAQLPALELRIPEHIVGKDTAECMISGAVAGTAAILDGIVADIEEELGQKVSFVITGGGAKYADSLVRHPHVYDPELILKGLAYLYYKNSQ